MKSSLLLILCALLAAGYVLSCANFDQHAAETAQLRARIAEQQKALDDLAMRFPELEGGMASIAQRVTNVRDQLAMLKASNPEWRQLLEQMERDVSDLQTEVNEVQQRLPDMAYQIRSLAQYNTGSLNLSDRVSHTAQELRSRADVFRTLAGMVGIRMGGDVAAPAPEPANNNPNPLGVVLGTLGAVSTTAAGVYGTIQLLRGRRDPALPPPTGQPPLPSPSTAPQSAPAQSYAPSNWQAGAPPPAGQVPLPPAGYPAPYAAPVPTYQPRSTAPRAMVTMPPG